MVRMVGLEPTRLAASEPKSGASTNFATSAQIGARIVPESSLLARSNYQSRLFAAFLILAAALAFTVVMMTFTATAAFAFTMMMVAFTATAAFAFTVVMVTFAATAAFAFTVVMVTFAAAAAFAFTVVMVTFAAAAAFTFIVVMMSAATTATFTLLVMMVTAAATAAFTLSMMVMMAAATTAATAVVRTRQRNGSKRFLSCRNSQTHAFEHGLVLFDAGHGKTVFGLSNTHAASSQGVDGFLHQVEVARDLEDRFHRSFDLVEATVFVNENVTNLQRTNFA